MKLQLAMKLSLMFMAAGSHHAATTNEGFMTDIIEACFRAVWAAIQDRRSTAAEMAGWCAKTIARDPRRFVAG